MGYTKFHAECKYSMKPLKVIPENYVCVRMYALSKKKKKTLFLKYIQLNVIFSQDFLVFKNQQQQFMAFMIMTIIYSDLKSSTSLSTCHILMSFKHI